jgi:addiction module RelE/StbE family toxin
MRVRYTEAALADLNAIFSYIAKDNPKAATFVVGRIEQVVSRIGDFPYMAHGTDEPGVRVIPVGRFPYLLFYSVSGQEVVILHVRHAARSRPWEKA